MSSIEWLEKEIYARGPIGQDTPTWLKELYQQAKKMHKQEIINAAERWKGTDFAERYYEETFGSKGSDDHIVETNEMVEISDEEIEKAARDYDNSVIYGPPLLHFEQGAFWYREQLKQNK
jgi:hypothetical protein